MQKRKTSEIKFHRDVAPGLRFLALDKSLMKKTPVYIAIRHVKKVRKEQPEYIDSHTHSVDSIYLFIGEKSDLTGLKAVVRIGKKERKIESPMTVFIPKRKKHSYKMTGGSGLYVSILLGGDYNANTFGVKDKSNG
jgi:hypothetical protein